MLSTRAAHNDVRSTLTTSISCISSLPLVDYIVSQASNGLLDEVCIIGGQHLLQTTHLMLQSLYKLGLKSDNIFLIGKCYSSNSSVFSQMIEDGIHVAQSSIAFNCYQPFDSFYRNEVKKFHDQVVKAVNERHPKKIVILDDGGEFLSQVNPDDFDCKHIVGIEQTSAGYNKLVNQSLKFPIINVARSWAKLEYESPIISEFALQKFLKCLPERTWKRVLVVGGGPIGLAIREKLRHDTQVDIFDTMSERSSIRSLKDNLAFYDLIIGCTGSTSIPHTLHNSLKKDSILVSVSSSDREFDAYYLRKKAAPYEDCHHNLSVDDKLLLNSGFPINFDGGTHSVPPKYIQLTRSLLVAAILQSISLRAYPSKIIDLCSNYQGQIVNNFVNNILSEEEKMSFYTYAHR